MVWDIDDDTFIVKGNRIYEVIPQNISNNGMRIIFRIRQLACEYENCDQDLIDISTEEIEKDFPYWNRRDDYLMYSAVLYLITQEKAFDNLNEAYKYLFSQQTKIVNDEKLQTKPQSIAKRSGSSPIDIGCNGSIVTNSSRLTGNPPRIVEYIIEALPRFERHTGEMVNE